MNMENNRGAAGLRRSAVAERIRLREEWSALKGTDNLPPPMGTKKTTTNTKQRITRSTNKKVNNNAFGNKNIENDKNQDITSNVLRGVVALVEVGSATRALALRAALAALGASVVPAWTPLITHLIWSEGGCRLTRGRARALASRVVSPLWVEACAASGARLPERAFPAPPRASDLPSPAELARMLKKAEMENIPLNNLFNMDEEKQPEKMRLRMSSETEQDTTRTTDSSVDTSRDQSRDKTDVEARVNTAARRALPASPEQSPPRAGKSRRKLFTQREAVVLAESRNEHDGERKTTVAKRMQSTKMTEREKKDLARAERMAKKLAIDTPAKSTQNNPTQANLEPRIVLTGMCRSERQAVYNAIKSMNGHIQKQVSRKTTHILIGSLKSRSDFNISGVTRCVANTSFNSNTKNNSPIKNCSPLKRCFSTNIREIPRCGKERTFNALAGAARGCRVLYAQWAIDSVVAKKWLHNQGYEVTHLRKISQKARVERIALGKTHAEYGYDVFNGMRVHISPSAEQRDVAIKLLKLCGAVVLDGERQNGVTMARDYDLAIGTGEGEVNSKWVFDSVASARMRTTRRYINTGVSNNIPIECSDVIFVSQTTDR